jgi:hypothetical protein
MDKCRQILLPSEACERVRALFEEDEFHPDELAPLVNEVAAKEGWSKVVRERPSSHFFELAPDAPCIVAGFQN